MIEYGLFLALYFATQFLPEGKTTATMTIFLKQENKEVSIIVKKTNNQNWQATAEGEPNPLNFQVDASKHLLKSERELEEGMSLNQFFVVKKGTINWKKLKELTPLPQFEKEGHKKLVFKQEAKSVTLSQEKGQFEMFKYIKISWD